MIVEAPVFDRHDGIDEGLGQLAARHVAAIDIAAAGEHGAVRRGDRDAGRARPRVQV